MIGEKPKPAYFVQRDRIQSGLSAGVAVVETDIKGGTMKTVEYCKQQSRILACYKHSINQRSEKSRGNEHLLQTGVLPLGSPDDIDRFINYMFPTKTENNNVKAIIFDLDMTLVDSSSVENLRSERRWKDINKSINSIKPYNNVDKTLAFLRQNNIKIAVVTATPEYYCTRILENFNWDVDVVVCYHDTKKHKPDPEPFDLAIKRLDVDRKKIISVGDQPNDIKAAHSAGILSIAALWGGADENSLRLENPSFVSETIDSIPDLILSMQSYKQ
jgi:HAD superfamily hydrolase (TIGR01662 family)